MAYSFKLPCV